MQDYMKNLKELEQKTNFFLSDKINELRYDEYQNYLDDDELRERLALTLMDKFDNLKSSNIKEVSKYIKMADKDLFIKLKDGVYTMDQIKARIAERKNPKMKYVVLDDLKPTLNEKFYAESPKN